MDGSSGTKGAHTRTHARTRTHTNTRAHTHTHIHTRARPRAQGTHRARTLTDRRDTDGELANAVISKDKIRVLSEREGGEKEKEREKRERRR